MFCGLEFKGLQENTFLGNINLTLIRPKPLKTYVIQNTSAIYILSLIHI